MVLDTNILIYLAQPGGEALRQPLTSAHPAASLISRVEAYGPGVGSPTFSGADGQRKLFSARLAPPRLTSVPGY